MSAAAPPLPDPGFLRSNANWLAAGALLTFSSAYGQTFFIALFAGEIRAEFGLTDGQWGLIYTAGTTFSAIAMLWAGALTDHLRVRKLAVIILPLLALACLCMALAPGAWALPLIILALRFTGQGMTSHIATTAMARWFEKSRGKALSVALMGFALAEAVLPIGFVWAMGWVDWRVLWVVAAAMALAAVPVLLLLLKQERTPQSVAEASEARGMGGRFWTRAEMLRHPLFWCMIPLVMGPAAFITAFFFQQVHLAEVKGWSHLQLVTLFPLYTVASVTGLWLWGATLDRLGTARIMPWFQLPMAAGFVVVAATSSLPATLVALLLMGMSVGGNGALMAAFWAEFYGTRHLGAIKATAAAVMVLGSALGPGLTGLLIDAGIPFPVQLYGIACWFLASSALAYWAIARARREFTAVA